MVDFRYHVVSIIAVFLALATGIVVGSSAIDEFTLGTANRATAERDQLRAERDQLRAQVGRNAAFATAITPYVIRGRLAPDDRVAIVLAPKADRGLRDQIAQVVEDAGATVVTQIRLNNRYDDPAASDQLDRIAAQVVPADVRLPAGTAAERAATVLAAVLIGDPTSERTAALTTVLSAFTDFLDVDRRSGRDPVPANRVIMVAGEHVGAAASPGSATGPFYAEVTLLRSLLHPEATATVPVLLAAPSAESGTLLAAVRSETALFDAVTTVDDVDEPAGRIALVLGLAQAKDDVVGHFGTGAGATGPVPSPSPTA